MMELWNPDADYFTLGKANHISKINLTEIQEDIIKLQEGLRILTNNLKEATNIKKTTSMDYLRSQLKQHF